MPVITARLSKLFYERLGEQIANELVDWFNAVDATYRSDLRELSEATFARFDAKMEQRLGELKAWLETRLDQRLSDLKLDARFAKVDADINVLRADIRADLKAMEAKLVKWMFLFWAGTALAGLLSR